MLGGGSGGLDVSAGASTASSSGGGGLWQFFFSPSDSSHLDSLNQPLNERDAEILEELRGEFAAFVAAEYADEGVEMHDVVKLTASHYFGIVPLHQNQSHRLAYLETCKALLSSLPP